MKLGLNSVSAWFGIIIIIVVLVWAFAIAFTDLMDDRLYGTKRIFFVIMLVAYAIYRGFRLRQLLKQNKYNNDGV